MKEKNPVVKEILEWVYCILIAIALALLIRYYVGTPTIVQMPSMQPTLMQGERLILNRWVRTTNGEYKRGDIVTFESPSNTYVSAYDVDEDNPIAMYENEPDNIFTKFGYYVLEFGKTSFIKRVIATEGEHIKIADGKVYINGEQLKEEYLDSTVVTEPFGGAYTDLVVPQGCVFVMGDNREQSTDSRRFGCIPVEKIESKVLIRFWPLNLFGKVK